MKKIDVKDNTRRIAEPPTRKRRRTVLRALEGLLLLFIVVVAVLGVYVAKSFRDAEKNGGYAEEWHDGADGSLLSDVAYGDREWELMDVYLPKEREPSKVQGAILFVHGGGWTSGSRANEQGFARHFAKEGWLTANMEYILYNDKLSDAEKAEYSVYKVLDEIDLALAKLKEVGAEHGYDVEKVAVSGHSAGGHLSALYGYTYKTRENANPPVEVAFVAPRAGPTDFYTPDAWGPGGGDLSGPASFLSFMSGVPTTADDLRGPNEKALMAARLISPAAFIGKSAVPTLAAYGGKDSVVPYTQYLALIREFGERNARGIAETPPESNTLVFDLLIFPNSNHMLGRDPSVTQKWYEYFNAYSERYLTTNARASDN